MAVSASISASPPAPAHGQTLTAAYSVTGNEGTPPQSETLAGRVVVGGVTLDVSVTVTMPGTDPEPVSYGTPTLPGVEFSGTDDPSVFTAVVP